jgi:leader peptidase (prepilin peptidase) / N-methyltransferase
MFDSMTFQLFSMTIIGLLVGSFLNQLIHRLPVLILWDGAEPPPGKLFSLRSHCPSCQSTLRWFHNIPVFSYAVLRGRCAFCNTEINRRYLIVEVTTAIIWFICGVSFGQPEFTWSPVVWAGFASAFLAMAVIDWETALLPDALTISVVWAGLLASNYGYTGLSLEQALFGAVTGYLSFKLIILIGDKFAGRETMGLGDAKLMAAIGALLGVMSFPYVLLVASSTSILGYYFLKSRNALFEDSYAPFGPFLVAGAVTVFIWRQIA